MKMKDQTKTEIEHFINMIFTQMNRIIKCVWIDNEKKFSRKVLINWLKNNKISYKATVLYESEQNEVAEWSNELSSRKQES
jgi:hypothetical protein